MSATAEEEEFITASGKGSKLIFNEPLPKEIRRALVREARRRNMRLNDIAGEALAIYFGMEWEPSGMRYRVEKARIDKLKVPDALHRRLREEALRIPGGAGTMRGVVLSVLVERLGLGIVIPRTRRPRS